jgi:hypothetical protein
MVQKHRSGHGGARRGAGGNQAELKLDPLVQLRMLMEKEPKPAVDEFIQETRQQQENLGEHLKALRAALDLVPAGRRLEFARNVWNPMRRVFGGDESAFSRNLLKVAEKGRAMTLGRLFFYGEKGARSLVEGVAGLSEPEAVLDMLLDATSAMTSHKRGIFLSESARPLLDRLGELPQKSQKQVLKELTTIGSRSDVSTAGSVFRLHALELLDHPDVRGSGTPLVSLRKLASKPGNLDEILFQGLYGKKEDVLTAKGQIFVADNLDEEDEKRLRTQVYKADGEVDYMVHPLFSLKYVDSRGDHFQPVFASNTGRGLEEYRQYQKTLEDMLESSERLTVIACDRDFYQQTRTWLNGLRLKGDVVIVMTRPSMEDDSGTPLRLREAKSKDSWCELASRMRRWGVVRVNVGGELSFAHLRDGRPVLDNEGSMTMARHCVAGAQVNLLKYFDVRTLNQAAFPDSPLFRPLEHDVQRKRREAAPVDADAITAALPDYIAGDVRRVFGSTPESLRYVTNVIASDKCDGDLRFAFQSHIRELASHGSQSVMDLFNQAVLLAKYQNPEVSDESVRGLCRLGSDLIDLMGDVPYFASHPETNRYVMSMESLQELSDVVSNAKARSDVIKNEVGKTGYGGLVRLMPTVMGRLTSPVRTDDNDFERQLSLLVGTIQHLDKTGFSGFITRDVREKTIAALLLYNEECGLLSHFGYMGGISVVLEPGIDLIPLTKQEDAEYGTEGKETMPARPHMLFIGASASELKYSLDLTRHLTGLEEPLDVLGEKILEDAVSPMHMIDVRMRTAGGMRGVMVKRLLEQGGGRSLGAGLTGSMLRLFDRSMYINAHSTYPVGLDEVLNGPNIDTLFIKGVERWVFAAEKTGFGDVNLDAGQKERLDEYLSAYADKVSPGGCVLVSSDDKNTISFFQGNMEFHAEPLPPILNLVKDIYTRLEGAVPIRQYQYKPARAFEQVGVDDKIGSGNVPETEYICLIPQGNFTIFRKTAAETTESAIEHANSDIIHSRGTEWYRRQLENKEPDESFFVWEERLKTRRVEHMRGMDVEMLVRSYRWEGREYPKNIVQTALDTHPQLWQKYRHNQRLLERKAGTISDELRDRLTIENRLLGGEIEKQELMELEAQGGRVKTFSKTRRQRVFPYQEPVGTTDAEGDYAHDDIRQHLYRQLGLDEKDLR